jgi:hypothetical protein
MITLEDFMKLAKYRITEGSSYTWQCYGSDAFQLDSWNGDQDGHSISVIFDTRSQEVYEVQAHDYSRQHAYRMINPAYVEKYSDEARSRNVSDEAWDDVNYVQLEVVEDFMEKAEAIVSGENYDTRVRVPLTLDKEETFRLMQLAHESDMTLNQYVEMVLTQVIKDLK